MSVKSIKSYWRELVAIIEGGLQPDPHRVSAFSEQLAQQLEEDGEDRLAQRIRRITERASKPAGSTFVSHGLPADVETQQFLIERVAPVDPASYPILHPSVDQELRRFVELNRRAGELASAGLDAPSTLLLFGPPGCGKTMAAVAIACDLKLPLLVVRLDSILGSYLGNSSKNLRRVFDNALSQPCVLLLDEFDAIGKMRDDAQEVGEIKRLVSSLLQNLDRIRDGQILIAATNHHHMLDLAIWRRFDVTLQLEKPGKDELASIISNLSPTTSISRSDVRAISLLADGLSGSDITSVMKRAYQDKFLAPEIPLQRHITLGVLARKEGHEIPSAFAANKKDLIQEILNRGEGQLTTRQVARLSGCSAAYVHDVSRTMED